MDIEVLGYRLNNLAKILSRVTISFFLIFAFFYHIVVGISSLYLGFTEPLSTYADIGLGVTLVCIFGIGILLSASKINWFFVLAGGAYWLLIPTNWIVDFFDPGVYHPKEFAWQTMPDIITVSWTVFIVTLVVFCETFANFLFQSWRSIQLKQHPQQVTGQAQAKRTTHKFLQSVRSKKGILVLCLVVASIPGALLWTPLNEPLVTIEPKDYDITYNFWAHRSAGLQRAPSVGRNYSWSYLSNYTPAVLDELNEHKVNLDIVMTVVTPQNLWMLLLWEMRCPSVTYRVVVSGKNQSDIIANSKTSIETLIAWETSPGSIKFDLNLTVDAYTGFPWWSAGSGKFTPQNITVTESFFLNGGVFDGWRGLAFDIEGKNFRFDPAYNTFEAGAQAWQDHFQWVHEQEVIRGKPIEMESISAPHEVIDHWDGDWDLQKVTKHVAYIPLEGWIYAPMIYRCEYETDQDPPFGSVNPEDPFRTAFDFYTSLYYMVNSVPNASHRGAYIGMTNCSCYGRDLPQHEYVDWGQRTGFWNLLRDVLICKHFEIPEVTFFLLDSASDDGVFIMGGVFESYGTNFLDVVNQTVNTAPPARFHIKYDLDNREGSEMAAYDWFYNAARFEGQLVLVLFWVIPAVFFIVRDCDFSSRTNKETDS